MSWQVCSFPWHLASYHKSHIPQNIALLVSHNNGIVYCNNSVWFIIHYDLAYLCTWINSFFPLLIYWAFTVGEEEFFSCHIQNYTEYNQQWNVFSAFNTSKCTHTWSSGQPTQRRPRSSWGFGALLKGLTSVMDNSCRSRDSNPQPRVPSPTLYSLGHNCPMAFGWHTVILVQIH